MQLVQENMRKMMAKANQGQAMDQGFGGGAPMGGAPGGAPGGMLF